jgi:hypothetical protein
VAGSAKTSVRECFPETPDERAARPDAIARTNRTAQQAGDGSRRQIVAPDNAF